MDAEGIGTFILSMSESGVHFDDTENKSRARQINEDLFSGPVTRCPDVKVVTSHGGGTFPLPAEPFADGRAAHRSRSRTARTSRR